MLSQLNTYIEGEQFPLIMPNTVFFVTMLAPVYRTRELHTGRRTVYVIWHGGLCLARLVLQAYPIKNKLRTLLGECNRHCILEYHLDAEAQIQGSACRQITCGISGIVIVSTNNGIFKVPQFESLLHLIERGEVSARAECSCI